jgi:4-alpha-glucanotransferase
LKKYANEKIKIVGDVPIFVALDSADVWCNPSQFKLNADGSPKVVAGVPPDYFSATGQLWGNPIYNWDAMRATISLVDCARQSDFENGSTSCALTIFAALRRAGKFRAATKRRKTGEWVNVPGKELFETLENAIGDLPFWAEDLGVITPDVEELRDSFRFSRNADFAVRFRRRREKSRFAAQLH